MELRIRCNRCVEDCLIPRFQVLVVLLLLEVAFATAKEFRLQAQVLDQDKESIISHSCTHDQIIERRKRPGHKVYSVSAQVYAEPDASKYLQRRGKALLGASKYQKRNNFAKRPIRIYLNYDVVGHSSDRDCRNVGDIVKPGEPAGASYSGTPSCNSQANPPIYTDCWYNCTLDDIAGDDKKHRRRKALGQTANWFSRALSVELVRGNLR